MLCWGLLVLGERENGDKNRIGKMGRVLSSLHAVYR